MSRTQTAWLLGIFHAVALLFSLAWLLMAGAALMGFTSVDVLYQGFAWGVIAYMVSYPLSLVLAIVLGWISFGRRRYRAALLWQSYPLLWIVSAAALLGVNWS